MYKSGKPGKGKETRENPGKTGWVATDGTSGKPWHTGGAKLLIPKTDCYVNTILTQVR
jgi:hypothetical protein